jgi:hypothetical protein
MECELCQKRLKSTKTSNISRHYLNTAIHGFGQANVAYFKCRIETCGYILVDALVSEVYEHICQHMGIENSRQTTAEMPRPIVNDTIIEVYENDGFDFQEGGFQTQGDIINENEEVYGPDIFIGQFHKKDQHCIETKTVRNIG